MEDVREAVATLQKRDIAVRDFLGPSGWRYQLSLPAGGEYEFGVQEMFQLQREGKLTAEGIKELAEEMRKKNEK